MAVHSNKQKSKTIIHKTQPLTERKICAKPQSSEIAFGSSAKLLPFPLPDQTLEKTDCILATAPSHGKRRELRNTENELHVLRMENTKIENLGGEMLYVEGKNLK